MRKEKDPDPQLFLMDPDPGGPKHADPDPQHCKKSAFFPVFIPWSTLITSSIKNLFGVNP
jgi:hypothetical protein